MASPLLFIVLMKSLSAPAFLLLLLSCLLLGDWTHAYEAAVNTVKIPGRTDYYSYYLRNAVPLEQEMTFEKLKSLIQAKNLNSVEQVIQNLPFEMLNDNYVLMYHSRSLQDATPQAPRALLYSPTARFVLSFNGGEPGKAGAQTLEIIQFRDRTRSFELREIEFLSQGNVRFSDPNPKKCLECHQSSSRKNVDPRPNWEPYSRWPGAFGSDGGRISGTPFYKQFDFKNRIQPQDKELMDLQSQEQDLLDFYLNEVAPKHPRYSLLGKLNLHATTDLTEHLGALNFDRVVRMMSEHSKIFSSVKNLMIYGMACYPGEKLRTEFPLVRWLEGLLPSSSFRAEGMGLTITNFLMTLPYEALGVDTSDWSMDFGTRGRFAFQDRFGTPSNPVTLFRRSWNDFFPQLQAVSVPLSCPDRTFAVQEEMKTLYASQALQKIRAEIVPQKPNSQAILNRCARCHAGSSDPSIPAISYDDPLKLRDELSKTTLFSNRKLIEEIELRTSDMATKRQQMPPSGRLTPQEREVFLKYLKSL